MNEEVLRHLIEDNRRERERWETITYRITSAVVRRSPHDLNDIIEELSGGGEEASPSEREDGTPDISDGVSGSESTQENESGESGSGEQADTEEGVGE